MATICVFEANPQEQAYLKDRLQGDVHFIAEPLTQNSQLDAFRDSAEVLCVFVQSKVTAEMIHSLPNLKLIATRSTGFNHVDCAAAKERGIPVSTVPTYGVQTVAEHAFALLLAVARHLTVAIDRTRHGDFTLDGLQGFDLEGKTFGVIGAGRIGQHSLQIAKGFGMKTIAFDAFPNQKFADEQGFTYMSLDEVLAQADVVSVHAILTPETRHLINTGNIEKCKQGQVIINTARGELIQTEALLRGLESGRISAAGLDVIEEEQAFNPKNRTGVDGITDDHYGRYTTSLVHRLLNHPRVIVTPHSAFDTIEAVHRILDTTVANIEGGLKGEPANIVK